MNVTLKNKTGRAKVIVLDHPAFRTKAYGFRRRQQATRKQAKDGSIVAGEITREEPGSIRLPAKGEVTGLHPAIRNCAQVRTFLLRREVEIVPDNKPTSGQAVQRPSKRRPSKSSPSVPQVTATSDAAVEKGDG